MRFPPLAVIESFPHGLSKPTDSNPHHHLDAFNELLEKKKN
jgi:hypothetical protein